MERFGKWLICSAVARWFRTFTGKCTFETIVNFSYMEVLSYYFGLAKWLSVVHILVISLISAIVFVSFDSNKDRIIRPIATVAGQLLKGPRDVLRASVVVLALGFLGMSFWRLGTMYSLDNWPWNDLFDTLLVSGIFGIVCQMLVEYSRTPATRH